MTDILHSKTYKINSKMCGTRNELWTIITKIITQRWYPLHGEILHYESQRIHLNARGAKTSRSCECWNASIILNKNERALRADFKNGKASMKMKNYVFFTMLRYKNRSFGKKSRWKLQIFLCQNCGNRWVRSKENNH